jgi:hypothetical protein
MTHRDRLARHPQIALHQLPRPIDPPLERAPDQEPRPDLAHIFIEDRLAALIAKLDRQLPQPPRRNPRTGLQLLADPLPERIELRPRRLAHIPRRSLAPQRTTDRATVKPTPTADLPKREPLDPVHPPDLSPLLHPDHTLLLARSLDRARVKTRPDAPNPAPGGSLFNRRTWVSIQPAPTSARASWTVHRGRCDQRRWSHNPNRPVGSRRSAQTVRYGVLIPSPVTSQTAVAGASVIHSAAGEAAAGAAALTPGDASRKLQRTPPSPPLLTRATRH